MIYQCKSCDQLFGLCARKHLRSHAICNMALTTNIKSGLCPGLCYIPDGIKSVSRDGSLFTCCMSYGIKSVSNDGSGFTCYMPHILGQADLLKIHLADAFSVSLHVS